MILGVEGCEGYDDTVVKGRYGLNTAGQDGNTMGDVRALDEPSLIGFVLGQSCERGEEGRRQRIRRGKHTIPLGARKVVHRGSQRTTKVQRVFQKWEH
jgi:hypothetical protein